MHLAGNYHIKYSNVLFYCKCLSHKKNSTTYIILRLTSIGRQIINDHRPFIHTSTGPLTASLVFWGWIFIRTISSRTGVTWQAVTTACSGSTRHTAWRPWTPLVRYCRQQCACSSSSCVARNFHLGAKPLRSGGRKSSSEVQGEALVGVSGKLKQFADIVCRF